MTERIKRLKEISFHTKPSISSERALLETAFYLENDGKYSIPVMRASFFKHLCQNQTIYIGKDELIVGERGPSPKCVPTYPELTCHTIDDLKTLNDRKMTAYQVSENVLEDYRHRVIPYWKNRSIRSKLFKNVTPEWMRLYQSGLFTEFMEQRAPGHTTLDGKIYRIGMADFIHKIDEAISSLDFLEDASALKKLEELKAMKLSCEAIIIFAERHSSLALEMAKKELDDTRRRELLKIAEVCHNVPRNKPETLHEALQMYWFVHLGTIMELNGWDSMNPGHIDQHVNPFFLKDLNDGNVDEEAARELIECFLIKFNNQPAPPKVGVTAEESGTYNDFTNINLAGLKADGSSGANETSYLFLESIDELHLLQPGNNLQLSKDTPDDFFFAVMKVIKKGYGYPSVFNADGVVKQLTNQGKTIEDSREGGCSGCIETGAFGKEAYILTGYLNVPKVLELTLFNGLDPLTDQMTGIATGETFQDFHSLYGAFERQLDYVVSEKLKMNNLFEAIYASNMPAPFLSVLIDDCIKNGRDYYDGGARYNTNYIQCCGIGTIADSLAAIKKHVFDEKHIPLKTLLTALKNDFKGSEPLRLSLKNKTPFYGNDDDFADDLAVEVFNTLYKTIHERNSTKGQTYQINFLSTTCHVYFGKKLGATPNGRRSHTPLSDGTSPSHGADRNGPSSVIKSLSKLDQEHTGGTLLNQKILPELLKTDEDIRKMMLLIRTYFKLGGHHIQFNVINSEKLIDAQKNPDKYAGLLVRVAGYSDYFVDLDIEHQNEIISRTQQGVW
ncbi:MAG TPA: glycyl radical protein [Thermotogota bacterium]|nr:glycyl radical protein [Thermotogota bacterium]HPR95100.1 glycyl radical protein [Thermotogota bacterium]